MAAVLGGNLHGWHRSVHSLPDIDLGLHSEPLRYTQPFLNHELLFILADVKKT
jgi:hypothetical protein